MSGPDRKPHGNPALNDLGMKKWSGSKKNPQRLRSIPKLESKPEMCSIREAKTRGCGSVIGGAREKVRSVKCRHT